MEKKDTDIENDGSLEETQNTETDISSETDEKLQYFKEKADKAEKEILKWKEKVDFMQKEAKNAFTKRDEATSKLRSQKDYETLYIQQKEDYDKLRVNYEDTNKKLDEFHNEAVKSKKINMLTQVASQLGVKPEYLNKLGSLIDLNKIDVEFPASAKMAVEEFKKEWKDLFGSASVKTDQSFSSPRLGVGGNATVDKLNEDYEKLKALPKNKRSPDHLQKLANLREAIFLGTSSRNDEK